MKSFTLRSDTFTLNFNLIFQAAHCTASGLGAISCALMGLLEAGDHVIASDTLYGGTLRRGEKRRGGRYFASCYVVWCCVYVRVYVSVCACMCVYVRVNEVWCACARCAHVRWCVYSSMRGATY